MNRRTATFLALAVCLAGIVAHRGFTAQQTRNVFLITFDGMRWQEVFTGADSALIHNGRYTSERSAMLAQFWDADPIVRRDRLLPFLWTTIASEGQIYGNRSLGCNVDVSNNHVFSYPGYNEILTGRADDERITSNDKNPNPNVTILEAVNRMSGFEGRVAAFGSWDVFPYIINEERSGVPVNAGFELSSGSELSEKERLLNTLQAQVPSPWSTVRLDAFTHHYALETLREDRPRLLYIAYGETDDFGHDGDFDAYLTSARRTDAFIRELWEWAQSQDEYRGRTTFVITTDHGRGFGNEWTGHGTDVDGARGIWLAVIGPDTPLLGEVAGPCELYQNQVAATVARLLGVSFSEEAGPAIESVVGGS